MAPNKLAGAADSVVVIEGTFENPGLLDLRMLVHRQGRTRRPFKKAGHLPLGLVLVEDFDGDAFELSRFPLDIARLDVDGTADRWLDLGHGFARSCLHLLLHEECGIWNAECEIWNDGL